MSTIKNIRALFPWLLVGYEILVYLSMDAFMPALPRMSHHFNIAANNAQLSIIIWIAGAFIMQWLIGPLTDRYGRRPVLLLGGVLFFAGSWLCAMAPSWHWFLLARLIQGIAMPTMYIAGYACVNELFDSEKATKVLAQLKSVSILAPALGPLFGSGILQFASWQSIFYIIACFSVPILVSLYFFMPETLKYPIAIQIKRQSRDYFNVLKNTRFAKLATLSFLPLIGLLVWSFAGPFIVETKYHYNTYVYAITQCLMFGAFIVGTKVVTRIGNKNNFGKLTQIAFIIALIGSALALASSLISPPPLFLTLAFLLAPLFASGMSMPILSRKTLDSATQPMGIRVTVFSIYRLASGLLSSLCILLFFNNQLNSITIIVFIGAALTLTIAMLYP